MESERKDEEEGSSDAVETFFHRHMPRHRCQDTTRAKKYTLRLRQVKTKTIIQMLETRDIARQ